mgnify:CR=1 FL=1
MGEVCTMKAACRVSAVISRFCATPCRLNQYQFAEHIGISQTHLSNIEHNNVQVSLKLLVRSANVFGCNLETLLDKKAASEWVGSTVQRGKGSRMTAVSAAVRTQLRAAENTGTVFAGGSAPAVEGASKRKRYNFFLKRGFCRAVDKIISTDCCKDEWEY